MARRSVSHKPGQFTSAAVPVCVLICALACLGTGLYLAAGYIPQENSYRELSQTTVSVAQKPAVVFSPGSKQPEGKEASSFARDWDALQSANPATAAWVTVQNTPIDYPVVACSDSEEEAFYLTHTLWGEPSVLGTPFIDSRCAADSYHSIVYGHHMTSSDVMFSTLQYAFRQNTFSTLGKLVWDTAFGQSVFVPLCALTVYADWPDIQTFSFDSLDSYRDWLRAILSCSTAYNTHAQELIDSATQDITLVTCTSDFANQPDRTVVVWVR